MIKRDEIVWMAGFMEGEGSFGMHKQAGRAAMLQVSTTDKDIADMVASLLRVKKYGPYTLKNPRHKPCYSIKVLGNRAIGWMMMLYPFLGNRRKQRIREVVSWWKEIPKRGRFSKKKGSSWRHMSDMTFDPH